MSPGIYVLEPGTLRNCGPMLFHYIKQLRDHFHGDMCVLDVAPDGNSARVLLVPDLDAPATEPPKPGMERVTTPHVMLVDASRVGAGGATPQ